MNVAIPLLILAAVAQVALRGGDPQALGKAALDGASAAVELVLGLAGPIVLFLGLTSVVERAGGLRALALAIAPVLRRLFPEVPPDHPAMGAMVMNLAANALGLGNAATPFGLRAMAQLRRLAPRGDAASDAMCLFLAINTSGVSLVPSGIVATRAALGSADPTAVVPTTLLATACSTATAIVVALLLRRRWAPVSAPGDVRGDGGGGSAAAGGDEVGAAGASSSDPGDGPGASGDAIASDLGPTAVGWRAWWPTLAVAAVPIALVIGVARGGPAVGNWILPGLIAAMLALGIARKVPIYEAFLQGARDGLSSAAGIVPPMVIVLVAVGMLRSSGAVDAMVAGVGPLLAPLGVPAEVLPLALLRPLSGSGAFAVCTELLKTHGPDSPIGLLASTLVGSTETTFYVLAVYFGSVGVVRVRWALAAGLAADVAGAVASVWAVRLLL